MLNTTIMNMIKNTLKIPTKNNTVYETEECNNKLYFDGYVGESKKELFVLDYDKKENYGQKIFPSNINEKTVIINNMTFNIIDYKKDLGILVLDKEVLNLTPSIDIIYLNSDLGCGKDFALVTSPYSYTNRINKNTLECFTRIEVEIFIYNDLHKKKCDFYKKELQNLFSRDFIINKNNFGYIQIPLTIRDEEYNKSNNIIKATMLIRTYI